MLNTAELKIKSTTTKLKSQPVVKEDPYPNIFCGQWSVVGFGGYKGRGFKAESGFFQKWTTHISVPLNSPWN